MDWHQVDRSSKNSLLPDPCPPSPVDLKLTHVDCNPRETLVHFQGQCVSICELDYNILQVEIQNAQKTQATLAVGELCLIEDVLSNRWFRGRVQNKQRDLFDVFLLDYGNVLTVRSDHLAVISDPLLALPPKILCGFFANVLPVQECWGSESEMCFCSLIGAQIKGYIQALLPYKVLILEVPEINKDLVRLGLGRHVDADTFLLLVEMLLEVPVQQMSRSVSDILIEKHKAHEFSFDSSTVRGFEKILSLSRSKLVIGQKEKAVVTAAVNPGLFYCQLSSAAKDLKEMSEKLATAFESRTHNCRDKAAENLGLLCAVKGKDEKWYRGYVQCLPANSQVRVVFVDYGYFESVKVENVLQLPSDFLLTPIMAYPCSLSCLSDKNKDRESQQLAILRIALLGKELEFKVDGFSERKNVFSVTLNSADDCVQTNTDELKNGCIRKTDRICSCCPKWCTNKSNMEMQDFCHFEDIQDGSMFEGFVEHVHNPNNFWIRRAEHNDRFEDMMNKITDYFSAVQLNEETFVDPVPGVLCCAMYEQDMHYYRATVVNTFENGAEVFFVDFGNTERVPSMLIKKLPSDLAVEPHFAFNCSLAHVTPIEDCWTIEATEFFRKATSNKALLVHVIHKRDDTFMVDLYGRGTEKSESITTLMTRENVAEYWKYNMNDMPVGLVEERIKTDENRIDSPCESVSQKLDCKNANSHANEVLVEKPALTMTPESKARGVENFRHQKLTPGSELSVLCSHINSPSDFWCQNKKQKDNLDRLMEKLQDFYNRHTPAFQPHSICCAVRFQWDNKWYRGCCLGVKNEEVEVILVDYGMVVEERLPNIRALMPEFLELERQAFRCSLYNLIEPAEESMWSKEACTLLNKFVSGNSSNLICKIYSQLFVTNKGLCNVVDLQTPLQWASAHLVEKGVAMEIKCSKLVPCAYPCSFVYSSFNITIGGEELAYATHVVSPWEIYLHLDRNSASIDVLMERTTKISEELLSWTNVDESGNVCLAKYFGDCKWYRALAWPAQSSQHLNVFFVDFGNKQVAEKSSVFAIPREAIDLLLIPMQAVRCCLSNIPEEEHLPEVNAWLEKTIINRMLQAKFVAKDDNGQFICDLFVGNMHINEKVKELFSTQSQKGGISDRNPNGDHCKEGMNVSSRDSKSMERGQLIKMQKTPDQSKVIQGKRESSQRTFSKFKHSHTNHNLSDDNAAKKNQRKAIHKQENVKQINAIMKREKRRIPSAFKLQTSKVLTKMCDLPDVNIQPGFKGVGFISYCHSPDRVFIQMENDEQTILKMGEELNSHPFTANMKNITSEVNVGDLVAAKYAEDLAFYRAVVTNVASSNALTVEFVDYGNTATVDRKDIHLLTNQFMSQARLSTPCKLSSSHIFGDTENFIKEARGKPLIVEFVKNLGSVWEVHVKIFESKKHCAFDGNDEEVQVTPCKSRQELNATETVTEDQENDCEMISIIEETSKEISSVAQKAVGKKLGVRLVGQMEKLKRRRKCKYPYMGPDGRKKNGSPDKFNTPICDLEKRTSGNGAINTSHTDNMFVPETSVRISENAGVDAHDIRRKECHSVLDKPDLGDACPQDHIEKEDQVQHLFLAPVKVDFEYSGFAAAVTTPGEFYIVLEDLLLIMNTVSSILEDLPDILPSLPETHLFSGSGCLVKSDKKNKWCRAEIVEHDDESVIVNLVDYGQYAHFSRQEVYNFKRLPVELVKLPKITYPCLLRGIKPSPEAQWSDKAVVFFQECMCKENLQVFFKQYVSDAQWEVDVVIGGRNIAKELVDAGHAHYIDNMLGIRFHQKLGQRRTSQHIVSSIMPKVSDGVPSNHKPQSTKQQLLHGHLEQVCSADNAFKSNEEMPQERCWEGKTELPFSKNCAFGPGRINQGSSSGLRQCMLM